MTKTFTVPSGAYFVGAQLAATGLFQKRQSRCPAIYEQGSSKLDPYISNPHLSLILSCAPAEAMHPLLHPAIGARIEGRPQTFTHKDTGQHGDEQRQGGIKH